MQMTASAEMAKSIFKPKSVDRAINSVPVGDQFRNLAAESNPLWRDFAATRKALDGVVRQDMRQAHRMQLTTCAAVFRWCRTARLHLQIWIALMIDQTTDPPTKPIR